MRFALVGCGVIAPVHAAAIAALDGRARLVAAVDPHREAAEAVAREHGAEPLGSLEEALARPDVDAVAVCTPSGMHVDVAVQALRAGKHVVIEKPLDVDPAAAVPLAAAERESGAVVTVISQHRFDPASQVVHEAVSSGRFGALTSGLASIALWRSQRYYASGEWRGTRALDGGGALMNQGIHQIDLLVWMLGEPVEVTAATATLAHEGLEVEDTGVATVRFASGALAVVHGTTAAYPGSTNRVQVHGTRGSGVIDGERLTFFHAAEPGQDAPDYGAGRHSDQSAQALPGGGDPGTQAQAHARQYADLLDAVEQGRRPLVTVEEAARTLAVVTSIYRSARQGGRPVPVELPAV